MDRTKLKDRVKAMLAAGAKADPDAMAALHRGERISMLVERDASAETVKSALDLERDGLAVVAVKVDPGDSPAHAAELMVPDADGALRLLAITGDWPTEDARAAWMTAFVEAGGTLFIGPTGSQFADVALDGVTLYGLAEVLYETGQLSHTFILAERRQCRCGCGQAIEATVEEREKSASALAALQAGVLSFYSAEDAERVSILKTYATMQRSVGSPQVLPVGIHQSQQADDATLQAFIAGNLGRRIIHGTGAWLTFAGVTTGAGTAEEIIDIACDEFTTAHPSMKSIGAFVHRFISHGGLSAIESDMCLPRQRTFSAGMERLIMLASAHFHGAASPPNIGAGLVAAIGKVPIIDGARLVEVRYRHRAIIAAGAQPDMLGRAEAIKARSSEAGPVRLNYVDTSALALVRAAALLASLPENELGGIMPLTAEQQLMRTAHPGFMVDAADHGEYGFGGPARMYASNVMGFAVHAALLHRLGEERALAVCNAAHNAGSVAARMIKAECDAEGLSAGRLLERAEQAVCDIWWQHYHGQAAS